MSYTSEKFKALGTDITLCAEIAPQRQGVLREIQKMFSDFEKQFSRFNPESELCLLNRSRGRVFSASPLMVEIMAEAKTAYEKTAGIFNPAILETLERLGYDKNFEDLAKNGNVALPSGEMPCSDCSHIEINRAKRTIQMPEGLKIDLGGIGKGFIVDRAAQKLKQYAENFWISAGGDMIFSGSDRGQGWSVGVQNPLCHEADIMKAGVPEGMPAVATSGTTKRKWTRGGKVYHHIIDPRTASPAENNLLAVTVFADRATWADVLAKSLLILGYAKGLALINRLPNTAAIMIDKNLGPYFSENMKLFIPA